LNIATFVMSDTIFYYVKWFTKDTSLNIHISIFATSTCFLISNDSSTA
jgi:hypothetical protein